MLPSRIGAERLHVRLARSPRSRNAPFRVPTRTVTGRDAVAFGMWGTSWPGRGAAALPRRGERAYRRPRPPPRRRANANESAGAAAENAPRGLGVRPRGWPFRGGTNGGISCVGGVGTGSMGGSREGRPVHKRLLALALP